MRLAVVGALAVLALGGAAPAMGQESDPGEAYGVYRPPPPPQDTAAPDTALSDSIPADTEGPAERVEVEADDTSLTVRMDVWRGGGLSRAEFPGLRESAGFTGRYTVFLDLMAREGPGAVLEDTAHVTLLAPTDSAFTRLAPDALDRLRSDSAVRARWARALVVEGDWTIADLLRAGEVTSRGGEPVRAARAADGSVRLNGARVVQPDLTARNGILHGVDRVVLPDTASAPATSAVP
ncbi:MAG TPA: fasciclin domain-containing protein [Gemmatimonadales bacterium]